MAAGLWVGRLLVTDSYYILAKDLEPGDQLFARGGWMLVINIVHRHLDQMIIVRHAYGSVQLYENRLVWVKSDYDEIPL